MMILTEEVMKQSLDTRLVAIHNRFEDGTHECMNFELSNGYVTKQTGVTTAHRHVIPGAVVTLNNNIYIVAVFTHITQVLVYCHPNGNINGFIFLDA